MNSLKTIGIFSIRILFREWKKFILPFLSLSFTTIIVCTVILFTNASSLFLQEKNKELIGGDISIESNYPLRAEQLAEVLGTDVIVLKSSEEYSFSGIVTNGNTNTPVSIQVVDGAYPIYGAISIVEGVFATPKSNQIYIDSNAQKKLNVQVGEDIVYANTPFTVAGIIEKDSRSLLAGFGFLPKVFISKDGFVATKTDSSLLRAEYNYLYATENTNDAAVQKIVSRAKNIGVQVEIAGVTESGLLAGLSLVKQFLVLAVLLSCILAAVNMYASMMYFLNRMRKSFAVLLSIGFSKRKLIATLSISLVYVLILSSVVGIAISALLFNGIVGYISNSFGLVLPVTSMWVPTIYTIFIVCSVSFASFIPSLKNLMSLNPKVLLSGGGEDNKEKNVFINFVIVTAATLVPLVAIAIFLLKSFVYGFASILAIIAIYVVLAVLFYYILRTLYKKRDRYTFLIRALVSYKYKDGLFGIVSLTSLYVALFSLSVLILVQANVANFIRADLGEKLPSVYVIDIQKSQTQKIKENFTEVTLFPNVGARIVSIDNLDIQKSVALADGSAGREFGREYNLTYRDALLPSEKVVKGAWLKGNRNEVSVEKDFADRANIRLGSTIVFSISGFELQSTVTSIREADSRSGLPFFYFVFNPIDLESYPATFFGYSYVNSAEKNELTNFLATQFPNVSIIDTGEVRSFASNIIDGLLVIVFVISLPPVVLALFLIVTLIISSFAGRRKQSAQLLALGAQRGFIEKLYYIETVFTTLCSGILGYGTAILATIGITKYYFKINSIILYDVEIFIAFGVILVTVLVLASILWRSDTKSLRELLSYEEN